LGIGLTLVRSLVGLHGGTVRAHSDGPGKGSEFTVRLPLRAGPPPAAIGPAEGAAGPTGRSLRVVVVDDNRDAGESLGQLLRLHDHQVRVFPSGAEALEAIPAFRPDVVLLDIGLPDLDGYQVALRLRQLPGGADVFLVAVTGYGQEEHRRRAAAAGFDYHLVKPINFAALHELMQQIEIPFRR
jgi:two-component system CheB/CheR fusion protein